MSAARDNEVTHDLSALAWAHDELQSYAGGCAQVVASLPEGSRRNRQPDVDTVDPAILRSRTARKCTRVPVRSELVGLPTAALMLRAPKRRSLAWRRARAPRPPQSIRWSAVRLRCWTTWRVCWLASLISPAAMFPQYKALQESWPVPVAFTRPTCDQGLAVACGAGGRCAGQPWRADSDTQSQLEAETLALMRGRAMPVLRNA